MLIYRIITTIISFYLIYKELESIVLVHLAKKSRKNISNEIVGELLVDMYNYRMMEYITLLSTYNMLLMFIEMYFIDK